MIDANSIERLRTKFYNELSSVKSAQEIKALRDRYLGRKNGDLASLLKTVGQSPVNERPKFGRLVNELKSDIERGLATHQMAIQDDKKSAPDIDVTLAGRPLPLGHRHPLTVLRDRMDLVFTRMGFEILEGPEAEDEYHNFEALQMFSDHPARDMQDTLYLGTPIQGAVVRHRTNGPMPGQNPEPRHATLLRTHTSAMQIRYMEEHPPPVRIIVMGRVYRRDSVDLTHLPMFQQVEGLLVGEGISLADLKGTLISFLREIFDTNTAVRFRPSFFPYTEPSAEVDIGCVFCKGSGCAVCKKTGWLEVLGSGMVHPAVLESVGYDSERYTGFAFGIGVERVAQLKYGVNDMRLLYENDLRFLEQFPY